MFRYKNKSFDTYQEMKAYVTGEDDNRDEMTQTLRRLNSIGRTITIVAILITIVIFTMLVAYK